MMTIRLSTGQNDLEVCRSCLMLAYYTGVISMRTKWFSIDANDGLRWKDLSVMENLLGRVWKELQELDTISDDEYLFARYIGINISDE